MSNAHSRADHRIWRPGTETHRTGHGIGLALHEPPDVSKVSEEIVEPGMVFSVEPGIYLEGKYGVRIEDMVWLSADGTVNLTKAPKEMIELF